MSNITVRYLTPLNEDKEIIFAGPITNKATERLVRQIVRRGFPIAGVAAKHPDGILVTPYTLVPPHRILEVRYALEERVPTKTRTVAILPQLQQQIDAVFTPETVERLAHPVDARDVLLTISGLQ